MANYSKSIADAIISYMDGEKLKYTFDPDRGIIKAGFNVSDDCIIGSVDILIGIHEDDFLCSGTCPINAPANRRAEAAELLTRLNWVLRNGNFEMDYSDGEIRYKVYVDCEGLVPSPNVIEDAVHIPPSMFSQYGQSIADVITGAKDAETAFNDRNAGKTSRSSGGSTGGSTSNGSGLGGIDLEALRSILGSDFDLSDLLGGSGDE